MKKGIKLYFLQEVHQLDEKPQYKHTKYKNSWINPIKSKDEYEIFANILG